MGLLHPLDLSDWAKNLTMRIFYCACRNPGRKNSHFQLLTHHYIARRTLICSIKKLIWAILETQFGLCFIRIFISRVGSKSCSISSWENKYNIYMLVTLCVFFFREVSYKDHNQQAKCWKWVSSSSFLWFVYFWHEQFDEELTNKKSTFWPDMLPLLHVGG